MFEYIKKFLSTNTAFLIIVIIVVFSLYQKAINYELLQLDDMEIISSNISYISEIKNIPNFFLQDVFFNNKFKYYRPILPLSFSLETIIFGYHPQVYHTSNILLFIISFYLIYFFCLKLQLNKNISKFFCLLFLVHPIFTSLAVWVSARNDSLLLIFVLLSFINFINYITLNKNKYLIYTIFSFLLALFTKETSVISLLFYFMLVYCFNYKISKQQIYKLLFGIFLSLTIYFVLRTIAVSSVKFSDISVIYKNIITNTLSYLLIYTEKFILCEYIPVLTYNTQITKTMLCINISLSVMVIYCYIKNIIDRKKILFCFLWYICLLFPTFINKEQQILFHRLLLPSVSIIIFLVLFTQYIVKKYPISKKYLITAFVLLFISLSYASILQKEKYKTSQDFIINCHLDSKNRISDSQFINFLIDIGNLKEAKSLLKERMRQQSTIKDTLTYAKILFFEGNIDEAKNIYLKLEKALPNESKVYFGLSIIYFAKRNYDKSEEYIQKAYSLNKHDTYTLCQMGLIYLAKEEYQKSLDIYENLLKLDKDNQDYIDKIKELKEKLQTKETKK